MCESQVITVCQDITDSMDNGDRIDVIVIDFSKAFDLAPRDWLLIKIAISVWIRGSRVGKGVPFGSHAGSQSRRAVIRGS